MLPRGSETDITMGTDDLVEFLSQIDAEVDGRASQLGTLGDADKEQIFARMLAEDLTEYGEAGDFEICLLDEKTSRGTVRSNGYGFDEESGRLDLLVALYRHGGDVQSLPQSDVRQAFERAVRIHQFVLQGRDLGDPLKTDQAAMLKLLRDKSSSTSEIRVFVVSNCTVRDTTDLEEEVGGIRARCTIWDLTRYHRIKSSGKEYEAIDIDIRDMSNTGIPCLPMPDLNCGYRTYLTLLPGDLLFRLYDRYGPRLLQLNVRSFLQARGGVNKGIRETIINEPERFLAYNNGLTATVEEIDCEVSPGGALEITRMRGFQIVNGGQTVASIHLAAKKDRVPIERILVQAKISRVEGKLLQELVPKISRFANTQNRINEADFSSNDQFHVKLEELAERTWAPGERTRWFYERARGQYQVAKARASGTPKQRKEFEDSTPNSQKFTKTDLAKFVNTWMQLPHFVSRGAQKNFTLFMHAMAQEKQGQTIDETRYRNFVAQAIVFKAAEKVAARLGITPYRANVITYTVALLSYRTQQRIDLGAVWARQSVSEPLLRTLDDWMPKIQDAIVASAAGRNVTEWCKREDCWRQVQMLNLELSLELERELAAGQPLPNVGEEARAGDLRLTNADRANIAKTMLLTAEMWLAIHHWGTSSGELEDWQCGIAHTLIGYASGGWAKVPSAKQARHAVGIIAAAKGHVPTLDETPGL